MGVIPVRTVPICKPFLFGGPTVKKSTIIFHDALRVVDEMPDELAGKFIKTLLQIMEGNSPVIEDFSLKMALHPFISQIKRDKESYKKQCDKNRLNGAKGGRPKNNPNNPSGLSKTQPNPKNHDKDKDKDKVKDKKTKYGEFKNVLLTENEYKNLHDKFNSTTSSKIETLSEYKARVGKTYKSDYLTILKWAKDDKPETKSAFE